MYVLGEVLHQHVVPVARELSILWATRGTRSHVEKQEALLLRRRLAPQWIMFSCVRVGRCQRQGRVDLHLSVRKFESTCRPQADPTRAPWSSLTKSTLVVSDQLRGFNCVNNWVPSKSGDALSDGSGPFCAELKHTHQVPARNRRHIGAAPKERAI